MFCHPVRAIFSRCTIHLSTDPVVEKSLCYCILYKNFTHKTSNTEPVLYEIFDLTLRNHDYYRNTHSISIGSVLASKTSFRQPEPIGPFRGGGRTNRIGSDRIDDRVDVDSVRGSDGSFRTVRWMPEPVGSPEPRVGADPVLSLSLSEMGAGFPSSPSRVRGGSGDGRFFRWQQQQQQQPWWWWWSWCVRDAPLVRCGTGAFVIVIADSSSVVVFVWTSSIHYYNYRCTTPATTMRTGRGGIHRHHHRYRRRRRRPSSPFARPAEVGM